MGRILVLVCLFVFSLGSFSAAAAEKEWTFLLYLNGNNNLDPYGKLNINQMEKVGSSDQVNMVVQWASLANGGTKRIYVQKDNDFSNVTSPVVQDMGKADMGDANVLEDFVRWGVSTYPAKHYFVAVWDHGSGWHAMNAKKASSGMHVNDISWDDNTGHFITTKQLGDVMNHVAAWMGRKIDIYGSDACMMGMVEVSGEMKNSVAYFVGSQETEPGAGWPYTEIFAPLVANPHLSPRDFSAITTDEYAKSYSPGGSNSTSSDVTMSAYDMSKYDAFKNAVANLGVETTRMPDSAKTQVFSAAKDALSFTYGDYVDFGDFAKKLSSQAIRDFNPQLIADAVAAENNFVVLNRYTGSFQAATGVSIWIPKDSGSLDSHLVDYQALQFDKDSRWSDALRGFVGK